MSITQGSTQEEELTTCNPGHFRQKGLGTVFEVGPSRTTGEVQIGTDMTASYHAPHVLYPSCKTQKISSSTRAENVNLLATTIQAVEEGWGVLHMCTVDPLYE